MYKMQAIIFGAIAIIFCSINVNAATFTVTKLSNSNDGTCDAQDCGLREAVAAAASGDTVVFDPNVGGTHTFGGSQIVITKRITIDGQRSGESVVFFIGRKYEPALFC